MSTSTLSSSPHRIHHRWKRATPVVELQPIDLRSFVNARIGSIAVERRFEFALGKSQTIRRAPAVIDRLRKALAARCSDWLRAAGFLPGENDYTFDLDVSASFYGGLAEATGRNLVMVEQLLPRLWSYEHSRTSDAPSFTGDFIPAFLRVVGGDETALHDLVSWRTAGRKKRHFGNCVLQIVLEFFALHDVVDTRFFDAMADFGISDDCAEEAIAKLSSGKMALIEPDGIYRDGRRRSLRRYLITEKGRFYARRMLNRPEYYEALAGRLAGAGSPFLRSSRSYLHEVERG